MQPQDVFNRAFDDTTAQLDAWLPSIHNGAQIEHERTDKYWRVRLQPRHANACPAELMISRDQVFDCDIATESAVGQPLHDLRLFKPLLQAIADGRVVVRSWASQATGSELLREVIVQLDGGENWSMRRHIRAGTAQVEATAVAQDHVYVAYNRI